MNVLILDNSYKVTGAFKSILNAIRYIDDCNFVIVTPSKSNLKLIDNSGHTGVYIPFIEIRKSWKLILYFPMLMLNSVRVLRLIKSNRIDILHINDLYNLIGVVLKVWRPKTRVIYHVRLLPDSYVSKLYSIWRALLVKFADAIVPVSHAVSVYFPKQISTIIYDGAIEPKVLLKRRSSPIQFLYPANYIQGKGQEYAIDAFAKIQHLLPDSHLTFVGGNPKEDQHNSFIERLEKKVNELGLHEQITFKDFAKDIYISINECDIVLMFSESESFSMVCIEAGMCKKPTIATLCGGPSEIIINKKTGLLVENRNVVEMANAMQMLGANLDLSQQLGYEAYERCISNFSAEIAGKNLQKLYQSSF